MWAVLFLTYSISHLLISALLAYNGYKDAAESTDELDLN